MPLGPSECGGREEGTPSLPASSSCVPFPHLYATPVFDEGMLLDVFAEEQKDGGDAKEKHGEGRDEMEGEDTEGEGGEEGEDDDRGIVKEGRCPPLLNVHGGHPSEDMLVVQQQSLIVHPVIQGVLGLPPTALVMDHGDGMPAIDGGRVSRVPQLPSLTSPFPRPAPVFSEGVLQDVFAEEEREGYVNAGIGSNAEGGVAAKQRGKGQNEDENEKEGQGEEKHTEEEEDEEEEEEKEEEEEEGEQEDAEGSEMFVNSDKEMLDLFKDGDIENW